MTLVTLVTLVTQPPTGSTVLVKPLDHCENALNQKNMIVFCFF